MYKTHPKDDVIVIGKHISCIENENENSNSVYCTFKYISPYTPSKEIEATHLVDKSEVSRITKTKVAELRVSLRKINKELYEEKQIDLSYSIIFFITSLSLFMLLCFNVIFEIKFAKGP
jgi:hypothetical protein